MNCKKIFDRIFLHKGKAVKHCELPKVTLTKIRMASHPATKPVTLDKLSKHDSETVVTRVAEHPNTPHDTLEELAKHPHADVRIALCENPETPLRILMILLSDENVDVRYNMAENHNLPLAVLEKLTSDENPYVAARAGKTMEKLRQKEKKGFAWFPHLLDRKRENHG